MSGRGVGTRPRVAIFSITASTLGYSALPRLEWDSGTELPGYGSLVAWLYAAQAVLMLLLGVIVVRQRRRITSPSFVGGFGAPVIVAFAVGVGVAFSSALLYTASYYLDRNVDPRPRRLLPAGVPPLLPPVAYRWAALGFFVAVVVTALAALLRSQLTLRQRRRRAAEILRHDFPGAPPQPHPRIGAARDAIVRAQLTDRSWPLPVAYAVVFVLILGSAGLSLAGIGPRELALRIGGEPAARSAVFLSHLGTNLTALFAVAMAVAALLTHRSKGLHRIGVLWDLATFWPRTAHPLAPPCYAERAVPELTRRIECLTRRGGTVVLSGHSQGAVLVAATILHLRLPCLERVALLTHANPLHRLYSKIFPAHLGPSALRDVGERVGWRWLNLWRDTDPIGAWIFSCGPDSPAHGNGRPRSGDRADGVDRRCRDPHSLLTAPEDPAPPPIQGHRFDPDSDYQAAVRDLVARLPAA